MVIDISCIAQCFGSKTYNILLILFFYILFSLFSYPEVTDRIDFVRQSDILFRQIHDILPDKNSGIVDEDVDVAYVTSDVISGLIHGLSVRDVTDIRVHADAANAQFSRRFFQVILCVDLIHKSFERG